MPFDPARHIALRWTLQRPMGTFWARSFKSERSAWVVLIGSPERYVPGGFERLKAAYEADGWKAVPVAWQWRGEGTLVPRADPG